MVSSRRRIENTFSIRKFYNAGFSIIKIIWLQSISKVVIFVIIIKKLTLETTSIVNLLVELFANICCKKKNDSLPKTKPQHSNNCTGIEIIKYCKFISLFTYYIAINSVNGHVIKSRAR